MPKQTTVEQQHCTCLLSLSMWLTYAKDREPYSEMLWISGLSVHGLREAGPEQTDNSFWLLQLRTVLTPTSHSHIGNRAGNVLLALPAHHSVHLGKYKKHWFNICLQLFGLRCQQD